MNFWLLSTTAIQYRILKKKTNFCKDFNDFSKTCEQKELFWCEQNEKLKIAESVIFSSKIYWSKSVKMFQFNEAFQNRPIYPLPHVDIISNLNSKILWNIYLLCKLISIPLTKFQFIWQKQPPEVFYVKRCS